MADITVTGNESYFNEDAKFFKDVYIYGHLYYEFEANSKEIFGDTETNGTAVFNGPVVFNNNVTFNSEFDYLQVGILTVTRRFDVGLGGTVFRAISDGNCVGVAATLVGNIGIGSTLPQQKLDIAGSVKIDNDIYDSTNDSGSIGYYLTQDEGGIRWTQLEPSFTEGIFVYNEGILIGAGQSFRGINLKTGRGAGVATDPVQGTVNPSNPSIADVTVTDYWDYVTGGTSIYRNSNVGINNSNPTNALDVTGTVNITSTLNVDGSVTFNSTLDVDGSTTLNNTLDVDGATTLNSTLDVDGATTLNDILDVAFQKDINKKSDLMTRLYKNKIIMENSKCIFNNCKDIYKQLLKILIEKLKKLPIPEDFKKKAIKLMQKNKKLITKTKMTNKDIAELAKNFDLALLNLL